MRTIEINARQFNYKHKKKLLTTLYVKVLKKDNNWHFLFEPNLIIRTTKSKEVASFLRTRGWKYKIYNYPYTKLGYNENKRKKSIQRELEWLLHFHSLIVIAKKPKEIDYLINRSDHCLLNMLGHDYYSESKYYLDQAQGYLMIDYKAEGKPIIWVVAKLLKGIWKIL